ncbi:MAG: hypothetical protein RIQ52_1212 [Pseudomonadota bacterium]|jgi:hypothetical protein
MKILHMLFGEFRKALPPTLFFMVAFHVSMLLRHLDAQSLGVTTEQSVSATIGALVVGKVFLLLDNMGLNRCLQNRPLIYPVLFSSLVYSFFVSLAWCLEELVPQIFHHVSWVDAWHDYQRNLSRPVFLANHLVLMLWVLLYSFSARLIGIIGAARASRLFFGVRTRDA